MRRNLSLSMCAAPSALLMGALLAVSLSACMDSASILCAPDEFYCPATQRCSADGTACLSLADSCGDGERQPGEACDDGNRRNGDGCNQSCTSDETCGNDFRDPNEACDDGNLNDGDGCNHSCTSNETCSNDLQDPQEACDDGNRISGDGCSEDCKSTEFCGNAYRDTAKGEECDDGNNDSGDGCSGDCRSAETCGNGYVDLSRGEVCDDGNNRTGDKCSFDCLSNEACGNSYKDPWEACDDGNNQDGDQCSADCMVAGQGCGNGRVEPPELCDDGDTSDDNSCLHSCLPAECGDGTVSPQASYPEQCDPGHPNTDTATCTRACRISTCGDRYINIQAEEQCEDGNSDNCGTCNSTCKIRHAPSLANGFIDAIKADELKSEETFTLDDGLHPHVVFEFSNAAQTPDHVKIPRKGSAAEIAQAIITAIRGAPDLDIEASLDPNPDENDRVLLRNEHPTSLGNRAITETVQNENFSVQGMAGGAAGDCPPNMGCTVGEDCMPGLQCQGGICTP